MFTTLAQLNAYVALRAQQGKPLPAYIVDTARAHLQAKPGAALSRVK